MNITARKGLLDPNVQVDFVQEKQNANGAKVFNVLQKSPSLGLKLKNYTNIETNFSATKRPSPTKIPTTRAKSTTEEVVYTMMVAKPRRDSIFTN